MQPLQYDLRSSAAKDNSITHAAAAPSNLDAATTMRSADTELQSAIELRATVLEIAPPKPDGSRRQSRKKTILKHFLIEFLKGKLLAPKLRRSADKSLSQPGCSHSNTIYDVQLQKTIVLCMQPRHRATLTQPLKCDLQRLSCKTQKKKRKKTILKHSSKGFLKGTLLAPKLGKSADKSLSQPGCSHSNTIYDVQLQKTSITHAAAAPSNLDAATTMRSADTELLNTIELRATVLEIAPPKPDGSRRPKQKKDDFEALFKRIFKRKITSAKIAKIC